MHIIGYTKITEIWCSVIFIRIFLQQFQNRRQMVDRNLKIAAVRKRHSLLAVQIVMLHTVFTEFPVILQKLCAGYLTLIEQTGLIITVYFIQHFVGLRILLKLTLIIFFQNPGCSGKKLRINLPHGKSQD